MEATTLQISSSAGLSSPVGCPTRAPSALIGLNRAAKLLFLKLFFFARAIWKSDGNRRNPAPTAPPRDTASPRPGPALTLTMASGYALAAATLVVALPFSTPLAPLMSAAAIIVTLTIVISVLG